MGKFITFDASQYGWGEEIISIFCLVQNLEVKVHLPGTGISHGGEEDGRMYLAQEGTR